MMIRFRCWLAANGAITQEEIIAFVMAVGAAANLDIIKLPRLWATGTIGQPSSVKRIDEIDPGSGEVFFLPLWELLSERVLTRSRIRVLMARYSGTIFPWAFPTDGCSGSPIILVREDSDSLADRGDIYSLMAILALMREAEIDKNIDSYGYHFMNLVRCLPWSAREKWLAAHFGDFCRLIAEMHLRHMAVRHRFNIDWGLVQKQFLIRDEYKPRNFRARGRGGRFVVYADPILYTNNAETWQHVEFD